ncbi:MAG TPA: class I SAM-dependent methyltransferase [Trichocoleus sp.]|jgi:2-polyprenyl-3-methyl-5-hydroxy-6-metoxy-1,4-benzoquinol methylase
MSECIVCSSSLSQPLYRGIDKCSNCGHVFADLSLSNKELFEIYQKSYFFGDEYSDYVSDKRVVQKNFQLRLKTLKKFLKPERHRSLFEIGCAYGFFLEVAQSHFAQVQGIDITEDGIRYARQQLSLDVVQADFLDYDLGDRTIDVACIWDTIEHLANPHLYIEKLSKHMEKGALLAITTGDIESFNARTRKEQWRLIHPPTHIHYFSQKSLAQMLNNYGYEVVYSRYCGFYRSLDNVAYNILVLRWKQPKLYNMLGKIGILKLDFYLNLYDIMYVIARKKY